ncbi:hypothetical protein BCY80_21225 [Yersinia pestis]|nr:hypothetical protein BCY80_21225 [Yersinia pestis]
MVATVDTVNANIDTTFVAGAVATITLSVPVNDATADGVDTNQVDALVQDANGNAITGAAVVFSSTNGADIIVPTMNTGVNGVASTLLTHTVAGPAMWSPPLIRLTPISTPPLWPVQLRPSP